MLREDTNVIILQKSLTDKQRDLLNDMYNDYNQVYSHWFADDYDTAMIDNLLKESKRNFKNGMILINEYYKLL